jgi:hypothetical protein
MSIGQDVKAAAQTISASITIRIVMQKGGSRIRTHKLVPAVAKIVHKSIFAIMEEKHLEPQVSQTMLK